MTASKKARITAADPTIPAADLARTLDTSADYVTAVRAAAGITSPTSAAAAVRPGAAPALAPVATGPVTFEDLSPQAQEEVWRTESETETYREVLRTNVSSFIGEVLEAEAGGLFITEWSDDGDLTLTGAPTAESIAHLPGAEQAFVRDLTVATGRGSVEVSFDWDEPDTSEDTFRATHPEWREFDPSAVEVFYDDDFEDARDGWEAARDDAYLEWQAEVAARDEEDREEFEAELISWAETKHTEIAEKVETVFDYYGSFDQFVEYYAPSLLEEVTFTADGDRA